MLSLILAAAAAAAAPAAPADPLDRVRCVREVPIGSLSASRKVCHTAREWQRIRADGNEEARRIIQPGTLNDANFDPPG